MMPQRIAETDPFKAFTDVVGNGPFQFKTDERVQGSQFVYRKFDKYKPREGGESSFTSGPKIVHFDRIEWYVQPDSATKAAAMQRGEMDWWENPPGDLLPLLRQSKIRTAVTDRTGAPYILRPNHLFPPFDKPAVRRALMGAIDQKEFMIAMMGEDTSLWSTPLGYFPPASPLANDAGMTALTSPRDPAAVKTALEKAGYQGETVVLMEATDQPTNYPLALVAADMLKRVGVAVEYQATDWGTLVQRRALTKPPAEGGWNLFCTGFSGLDWFSPASHLPLRGNGTNGWFGWPTLPKLEELREAWFNASDATTQKRIGAQIQQQAFEDVPFYPLGLIQQTTAFRPDITDVPEGFVIFWGVRRG